MADTSPDDTERWLQEGLAGVKRDLLSLHNLVQRRAGSLHQPLQTPQLQDASSAGYFANMSKVFDSVSHIEQVELE